MAQANAGGLFVLFAAVVVAVRRRHDMLDRFATIVFGFMPPDDPRRFATRALSLIERRAYWAGGPRRPPGVTPRRWYPRVVGEADWGTRGPRRAHSFSPTGPFMPHPGSNYPKSPAVTTSRKRVAKP